MACYLRGRKREIEAWPQRSLLTGGLKTPKKKDYPGLQKPNPEEDPTSFLRVECKAGSKIVEVSCQGPIKERENTVHGRQDNVKNRKAQSLFMASISAHFHEGLQSKGEKRRVQCTH